MAAGKKAQPAGPRGQGKRKASKNHRQNEPQTTESQQPDDPMDIEEEQNDREGVLVGLNEDKYISIVMAEWDSKSHIHQSQWLEALNDLKRDKASLEAMSAELMPQLRAIEGLQARQVKDVLQYENTVTELLPQCTEWGTAARAVAERWEELETLELSAVANGAHGAGLAEAVKRKEAADERHQDILTWTAALEAELEKEDRDVPLDEQGRRRIPYAWNEKDTPNVKDSGMRAIWEEQSKGDVGVSGKSGVWKWVACRTFQASVESNGVLWLGLDEDEMVVDVSINAPLQDDNLADGGFRI